VKRVYFVAAAALAALALTVSGCANASDSGGGSAVPTVAANTPSAAFFAIPESLTGSGSTPSASAARAISVSDTVADDVAGTVEAYFAMVRDQVRFGADVADSVKTLISELEVMKFGDTFLLDWPTDLNGQTGSDGVYSWTVVTAGSAWKLEKWTLYADSDSLGTDYKEFELYFEKSGGAYKGYVILNGDEAFDRDPDAGEVMPAMMRIEFDSGITDPTIATLTLKLQDFRSIADIYDADVADDFEDAIIKLSKDLTTGAVSVASSIRVPNSRHFVWNGYDNTDTLNTASDTPETRFYCARGISSGTAADLARVGLGLPLSYDTGVEALGDANALGAMIAQLMTDRLNNDYDFGGGELGHTILSNLNSVPGITLDVDTWDNSSADVISALGTVRDYLAASDPADANYASNQASLDNVSFLLGIMSVTNPVYFASSSYTGYGSAPSGDYPDAADLTLTLPSVTEVTDLAIAFPQ